MKRKTNHLTRNIVLFIVPVLIVLLIRAIGFTLRYRFINKKSFKDATSAGNCIFVFWHQKFFPLLYSHKNSKINVMVSQHTDGELIARALRCLGFTVTRGSTSRDGIKACHSMTKAIKKFNLAITPDGPQGPRYHFSGGAVTIAKLSGRPIVPVGIGARRARYFSSWDRFMLPLPLSRVNIVFGNVHYIGKGIENEVALTNYLAEELNEVNRVAEVFDE
jgi:lysophospholipid acyltransferase (LPLAT)-like uncharacterized protein